MTTKEWKQHKAFMWAKRNAPHTNNQGKRSVKNKAKHVGAVLKHTRIVHTVHVETLFLARA